MSQPQNKPVEIRWVWPQQLHPDVSKNMDMVWANLNAADILVIRAGINGPEITFIKQGSSILKPISITNCTFSGMTTPAVAIHENSVRKRKPSNKIKKKELDNETRDQLK